MVLELLSLVLVTFLSLDLTFVVTVLECLGTAGPTFDVDDDSGTGYPCFCNSDPPVVNVRENYFSVHVGRS